MKEEMELKKYYKETFVEIHASETLKTKVQSVSKENETRKSLRKQDAATKKIIWWRRFATVAAALALLIVGSNGMAYAATGNTWLKTIVVCLNGTEYSADMNGHVEGDNFVTQGWLMGENGPTAIRIINNKDDADAVDDVVLKMIMSSPEIVEKDGKIYFKDGNVQIDITEDAEDGKASGTYQIDDMAKQYEVEYADGAWNVNICESTTEK